MAVTAVYNEYVNCAPKLILATEGLLWLAVTQSTPEITSEIEPFPSQLSTLTEYKLTFFATPQVVPPMTPATLVP